MSAAAKHTVLAAASVLALVAVSVVGTAGGARPVVRDRIAPSPPANPHVVRATASLVYVAWDASQDDVGVAGYYVYGDTGRATASGPAYIVSSLACGESSALSVVAFDQSGNRSPRVTTTISTAACPDSQPPTPPSGFRQGVTTQNAVVLDWTPSADNVGVVGYGVYRNIVKVTTTSEPSATLTGLTCGTTYGYSFDSADAAGNRSTLSSAFVQTAACSDGQPPTAPSSLEVTGPTQTSLSLSWQPASDDVGVTGYRVSLDGTPVMSATETSATLSGLVCGRSYSVGVDAFDAAGNRSSAVVVSAATSACSPPPPSPDSTPPSKPVGLAVSNITQAGLTIAWAASTDNVGVTGYDVYRDGAKVATVSSTSSNQSGLSCGTTYILGVVAFDAAGNASQQAQLNAATASCSTPVPPPAPPPPPTDTTPPTTPGALGITTTTRTSVALAWTASSDNVGVAGYRVYVSGAPYTTSTQASSTVSGLACGTAYTFEVDAYDAAGNRSSRTAVIGSTSACADTQPPTAPLTVAATSRTTTSIALSWAASSDNVGVAGYGLYRGGTQVATSSTTTAVFSGLACNTNYTLAVDAYDAAGNRSPQTVVMVSTTACADTAPPSAPSGLAASNVTQSGLTLTWTASTDNVGVTGYDVYRNGTKMATVPSTSSSQAGLACGASYSFGVIARDAAGNSSQQAQLTSTTASCSPPPPPPPPPSSVNYPASYFTGPLGNNNILPTKQGAFLIAQVGGYGVTWDQSKALILQRESDMGRKYDGIHLHHGGDGTYMGIANCSAPLDQGQEQWVHDTGHFPVVAWTMNRSLADINAGNADACIRNVADYYKSLGYPVMIRAFSEFDLPFLLYHGCGQPFIDAWRRIVTTFQARGATNVGWWWNPEEGVDRDCVNASYPGDQYVDWIGSDWYNTCDVGDTNCWSTPLHSGWAEFAELFNYGPSSQYALWSSRKPFVIGETSSVYDDNSPAKRGQWFRNIAAAARSMPRLAGVSFYDSDVSAVEGPRGNYRVDYKPSNPDVYAGFKTMAADSWFNTR